MFSQGALRAFSLLKTEVQVIANILIEFGEATRLDGSKLQKMATDGHVLKMRHNQKIKNIFINNEYPSQPYLK